MTTTIVRLDRLQAGLGAALVAALPTATVVWAPSEFPRAAANSLVLACRLLAGPDADPLGGESMRTATLPMTATVQILAATASQSVLVLMSGRRFEAATVAGDVEATRDALLAVLLDDPMVDATIAADGTDSITIEADEIGDLYQLAVRGSTAGLIGLTIDTTAVGRVQSVDVRSYVEVQAYSTSRYPRSGAAAQLNRFRGTMRLPTVANILDAYGLGVIGTPGRVVTLDALAGPTWVSRSALTFWIAQISLAAEAGERIETVRGSISVLGAADSPIQVSIETPEP